jgi:hypothetical protein
MCVCLVPAAAALLGQQSEHGLRLKFQAYKYAGLSQSIISAAWPVARRRAAASRPPAV